MTLELAKNRRLEALNGRSADRMLVRPAHPSKVVLPNEATVAGFLLDALGRGCDVEQLVRETGWSRAQVFVNLFKVAKRSGIGIRRKAGRMHLILPEGAKHMYPRNCTIDAKAQPVREMADNVIQLA